MTWRTTAVLVLTVALGSVGVGAQRSQPDPQGRSGFRAVTGAAAAAFRVPPDMRLIAQERVGRDRQIVSERYRQYVGNAEVHGGQLTVYRDDAGDRDAVVGALLPRSDTSQYHPTDSRRSPRHGGGTSRHGGGDVER